MKCSYFYILILICGIVACNTTDSSKVNNFYPSRTHSVISSSGGKVLLQPYTAPDSNAQKEFIYFHLSLVPPQHFVVPTDKAASFYIDFDIQKHMQLLQGTDTLYPVICQRVTTLQAKQYEYEVIFDRMQNGMAVFKLLDEQLGIGNASITLTETELN